MKAQLILAAACVAVHAAAQTVVLAPFDNSSSLNNHYGLEITPSLSQSGTAGFADLFINHPASSLGSGNQYLAEFQSAGADRWIVDHSGEVTITGNATALPAGIGVTMLHMGGPDSTNPVGVLDGFDGNWFLIFRRADGSAVTPTAIQSNEDIADIQGVAYGSSAYSIPRVSIEFRATENWTNSSQGTSIIFSTTPNGTTSTASVMTLNNDQTATFAGALTSARANSGDVSFFTGNNTNSGGSSTVHVVNDASEQTRILIYGSAASGTIATLNKAHLGVFRSDGTGGVLIDTGGSGGDVYLKATTNLSSVPDVQISHSDGSVKINSSTSGTSTTAAAVLAKSIGLTENLFVGGSLNLASAPPVSSTDTGTAGTVTWDTNYIYVCIATNTWKRVAISTW